MIIQRNRGVTFLAIIMLASAWTGILHADADTYDYYQDVIQKEPTGVYENNGTIYVNVRYGYDPRQKIRIEELRAQQAVLPELQRWILSNSPIDTKSLSKGVRDVVKLLDAELPEWRLSNWKFQGNIQQFIPVTDPNTHTITVGQAYDKNELLSSLPEGLKAQSHEGDWGAMLSLLFLKHADRNLSDFLARCGAVDFQAMANEPPREFPALDAVDFRKRQRDFLALRTMPRAESAAWREYGELEKDLLDYWTGSAASDRHVENGKKILVGTVAQREPDPEITIETQTNDVTTVVTNIVDSRELRGEPQMEVQTAGDLPFAGGYSMGRQQKTEEHLAEERTETTTTTTTIVTTCRRIHRSYLKTTHGNPAFEICFLSGHMKGVHAEEGGDYAEDAREKFFGNASIEERTETIVKALRINPGDKMLWNLYGRCLEQGGDYFGAIISYRNALQLDGDYEFALTNLAKAYHRLGYDCLATGMAIVARAHAKDPWCIQESESVLRDIR